MKIMCRQEDLLYMITDSMINLQYNWVLLEMECFFLSHYFLLRIIQELLNFTASNPTRAKGSEYLQLCPSASSAFKRCVTPIQNLTTSGCYFPQFARKLSLHCVSFLRTSSWTLKWRPLPICVTTVSLHCEKILMLCVWLICRGFTGDWDWQRPCSF